MATYAEQLEEVNAAISKILVGGQSVAVNDSMRQNARLETLLAERQRLERLIAREDRGGARIRQAVPR